MLLIQSFQKLMQFADSLIKIIFKYWVQYYYAFLFLHSSSHSYLVFKFVCTLVKKKEQKALDKLSDLNGMKSRRGCRVRKYKAELDVNVQFHSPFTMYILVCSCITKYFSTEIVLLQQTDCDKHLLWRMPVWTVYLPRIGFVLLKGQKKLLKLFQT